MLNRTQTIAFIETIVGERGRLVNLTTECVRAHIGSVLFNRDDIPLWNFYEFEINAGHNIGNDTVQRHEALRLFAAMLRDASANLNQMMEESALHPMHIQILERMADGNVSFKHRQPERRYGRFMIAEETSDMRQVMRLIMDAVIVVEATSSLAERTVTYIADCDAFPITQSGHRLPNFVPILPDSGKLRWLSCEPLVPMDVKHIARRFGGERPASEL